LAAAGAILLWDFDGRLTVADRGVHLARDAGALAVLPVFLTSRCVCASMVGEFATATSLIAEADAISEVTETRIAPYTTLLLGAAPSGARGRDLRVDRGDDPDSRG
jgi:hypothetical protein